MARIVCYTCITNGYDALNEPVSQDNDIDFICFSDNLNIAKSNSNWSIRQIPSELTGLSPVKTQRIIKICPHKWFPDYDISIWVDGNIKIIGDLQNFVNEYDFDKTPLYTRIHPCRNCIYDEADACMELGKDHYATIMAQIAEYKLEGYPQHIGMAETNILLRKHNDLKCKLFDNAWATELLLKSHRDQLSFNYICWKQKFLPGYLVNQFKINENKYFKMVAQH